MSESNTLNDHGVHDTLRYGPQRVDQLLNNTSEFESHLKNLKVTELERKLALQKVTFGAHMPLRSLLELHSVSRPPRPEFLSPVSNLQMDILTGNDETINADDVFNDISEKNFPDIHSSIIKNRRL